MDKFKTFIKLINAKEDIYHLVEEEFLKKYNVATYEELIDHLVGNRVFYNRPRTDPEVDCFIRLHAHKMEKAIHQQAQ